MCREENMTNSDVPDITALRISESLRLSTLPADILFIIFTHLDTARSFTHLAATCKGMNLLVDTSGWRIFVSTCFSSLSPAFDSGQDWKELARVLTAQSRDWDRRAFVFSSLAPPPDTRRPHGRARQPHHQTIPRNIIVDAHLRTKGNIREELLVWGAGEDILARIRRSDKTAVLSESWHCYSGSQLGFVAGKDDTTAVAILKNPSDNDTSCAAIIGRANGDLRQQSINDNNFGRTLVQFRPTSSQATAQRSICAVDINHSPKTLVAGTREAIVFYPIPDELPPQHDDSSDGPIVNPIDVISLKNVPQSSPFDYIRSVKSINQSTVAVALNRSFDPVQILTMTPSGVEITAAAKTMCPLLCIDPKPRTVRALLPVDMGSIASGTGNVVLSSWDDGTIRLQDLRTSSPFDRIYQDNFEVATPINALVSFGLERFVAGSAFSHLLKIFDYRWDKGYYHTDSLPCASRNPYPAPRPPTVVEEPQYAENRSSCNHVLNRLCRWHMLSRHDFYRPNCNIYLPFRHYDSSPIYTLAKPSDISPSIYAGLSGLLVEITLRSGLTNMSVPDTNPFYVRQRGKVAILETGDGSAIFDVSKSQRVPEIRRQSFSSYRYPINTDKRWHRLDHALVNPHEWQDSDV
ncbi:hypothetical protein F5Y16DRAFT_373864 [Xylariaceae sp. FL0255]|nr:hypothetical protein F5Y16DRAFT_373864 [Xylariaceae sp. FL0255]